MPTQFELGFLVGLLVGEGHFGGDGRQPHVTLRMHVRHEAIFRWLERTFPGGRVYGPYHHGGRDYLQWMARGAFLRDELAPVLDRFLSPGLDRHSFDRFQLMKARYPQLADDHAGNETAEGSPGRSRRDTPHRPVRGTAAEAGLEHATAPTVRAGKPTRDPADFADLFTELRQTWPS
jgi:hypothetical protein